MVDGSLRHQTVGDLAFCNGLNKMTMHGSTCSRGATR